MMHLLFLLPHFSFPSLDYCNRTSVFLLTLLAYSSRNFCAHLHVRDFMAAIFFPTLRHTSWAAMEFVLFSFESSDLSPSLRAT